MKTDNFYIRNIHGYRLAASLDYPKRNTIKYYALFVHCFTCTKELKAIRNIASALSEYGVALLRFDMTGIGDSEGDFSRTNFTTQIEDILSVSEYMDENLFSPRLIIGHSLGGCAAIYASFQVKSLKALCTIASPSEPSSLSLKLSKTKIKALENGFSEAEIGGVKYKFTPQFFRDIESYNLRNDMKKFSLPYLIMHSPIDEYTDIKHSAELFRAAKHPKSFISLDNIDHLMLNPEDAGYAGRLIAVWASRYI
ncbi:MAG: alpha/beta hydrolase [Ignavibacteria bacterium]|nr:alpha/beta hydrolase [Ignavibacteria bacterium]